MNQQAEDLLMGAPSEASPKQLRELHGPRAEVIARGSSFQRPTRLRAASVRWLSSPASTTSR
jgi:hypothetical protein